MVVDPVFRKFASSTQAPQQLGVGLVVAEEELWEAVAVQSPAAELVMLRGQPAVLDADCRHAVVESPSPRVAKPEGGQHIKVRLF